MARPFSSPLFPSLSVLYGHVNISYRSSSSSSFCLALRAYRCIRSFPFKSFLFLLLLSFFLLKSIMVNHQMPHQHFSTNPSEWRHFPKSHFEWISVNQPLALRIKSLKGGGGAGEKNPLLISHAIPETKEPS